MFIQVQFQLLTPTESTPVQRLGHARETDPASLKMITVYRHDHFNQSSKWHENTDSPLWKNHCYLGEKRERIFSRYFTGQFCAGCFDHIGTCLSHRRNTEGLVPIAYVMKVVWPSTPANSFQMLVSTAVAISHGGCSLRNVMIQSKIKSRASIKGKAPPPRAGKWHKYCWHFNKPQNWPEGGVAYCLIYSFNLFSFLKNTVIKKDKNF